jgi:hypothetical protein
MTAISKPSVAKDRSTGAIALICGLGLVASICVMSFGVDIGAAWL